MDGYKERTETVADTLKRCIVYFEFEYRFEYTREQSGPREANWAARPGEAENGLSGPQVNQAKGQIAQWTKQRGKEP